MLKEFKEFISKGNVLDLAIGIIIGAAFGTIVTSFVEDILTPILGIFGKADFNNLVYSIKPGDDLKYGAFITHVINFLIIAFAIFLIVKAANKMKSKQEAAPEVVATPQDIVLLSEIRDLLAAKK